MNLVSNKFSQSSEFYIKWSATLIIVLATALNAVNIQEGKYFFFAGNVLWLVIGVMWKQPAVWALNLICGMFYIVGEIFIV